MAAIVHGFFSKSDSVPWAHGNTAETGCTFPRFYQDFIAFSSVYAVGTVLNTAPAIHTLVAINADFKFRGYTSESHSINLAIIGSPALGVCIFLTSGSRILTAASSLEI